MLPDLNWVNRKQVNLHVGDPGVHRNLNVQKRVVINQGVLTIPTHLGIGQFFSNFILELREGLGHSLNKAEREGHAQKSDWLQL